MRVQSVGYVANKSNNFRAQNFKGLWGKTEYVPDNDNSSKDIYDTRILHYYPFLNETQKDIDNVIKENTIVNQYSNVSDAYPDMSYIKNISVKVEPTLPFTSDEWSLYNNKNNSMKPSVKSYITQTLKRFNLNEHIVKKNSK